jgi:UDP-N-acetylmuramoyl-tripeptide--D-alanyl-D-alanine ligase
MRLDGQFIKTVLPDAMCVGNPEQLLGKFVIDSRKISTGDVFVALKGGTLDGHNFITDALANGATGLLIQADKQACLEKLTPAQRQKVTAIVVKSPEDALYKLAAAWRTLFTCPIVGITGSIGKTTTKEMLATIVRLSGKECVVSSGNYNTQLGLALTLLSLRPEHYCAIVEMGISKRGEMARLAQLARPTIGVITTIAHQHMDGLGSLQDIASEKREIFKFFKPDNIGIINGDQAVLAAIAYPHPVVKFGFKTTNQVQARRIAVNGQRTTGVLKLYNERFPITLQTPHRGRLTNALASAAAAYFLNIPSNFIIEGIQSCEVVPGRFQAVPLSNGRGLIINDCYNANPESMKEALFAFDRLETRGHKIAVLGDMLGLGVNSAFWHRQLGRSLRKAPSIERVIFVGEHVKTAQSTIPRGVQYKMVPTWLEAATALEEYMHEDVTILVKASNGMDLQFLVNKLTPTAI